jgi:hypothetical protein
LLCLNFSLQTFSFANAKVIIKTIAKSKGYLIFQNAAIIIKNKEHLSPDRKGLEQLLVKKKI